jgi:hypothetical protein
VLQNTNIIGFWCQIKNYDIRISRNENIEDVLTFSPNDDTFDGDTELYLSEKYLFVVSWIT